MILGLVISLSMMAAGHQTFKGVAIDGSLDKMAAALQAKGFVVGTYADNEAGERVKVTDPNKLPKDKNTKYLVGAFFGQNVSVNLVGTPKSGTAYKVVIDFNARKQTDYLEVKQAYESLVGELHEKYGEPTVYKAAPAEIANFNELDKNPVETTFKTANGTVRAYLAHGGFSVICMQLEYLDNANNSKFNSEK